MKVNDCVEILTAHDKYLPRTNSGDPVETLMCGDGLSCKGVRDAQRIRQTGGNRMRKLSGFIPATQPKTSTSKPTTPADNAESQSKPTPAGKSTCDSYNRSQPHVQQKPTVLLIGDSIPKGVIGRHMSRRYRVINRCIPG